MRTAHPANIRPTRQPKSVGGLANSFSMTIEAWMPSEIEAISPLVDRLMRLIEGSHCVVGGEFAVEVALREALSNAVVHGNATDPHKLVWVRCRCETGRGVWLAVRDQGKGFDPSVVCDPLEPDGLKAGHGRGIHLMKWAMDGVVFEAEGTEVCMWKEVEREGGPEDANETAIGQPCPKRRA